MTSRKCSSRRRVKTRTGKNDRTTPLQAARNANGFHYRISEYPMSTISSSTSHTVGFRRPGSVTDDDIIYSSSSWRRLPLLTFVRKLHFRSNRIVVCAFAVVALSVETQKSCLSLKYSSFFTFQNSKNVCFFKKKKLLNGEVIIAASIGSGIVFVAWHQGACDDSSSYRSHFIVSNGNCNQLDIIFVYPFCQYFLTRFVYVYYVFIHLNFNFIIL